MCSSLIIAFKQNLNVNFNNKYCLSLTVCVFTKHCNGKRYFITEGQTNICGEWDVLYL